MSRVKSKPRRKPEQTKQGEKQSRQTRVENRAAGMDGLFLFLLTSWSTTANCNWFHSTPCLFVFFTSEARPSTIFGGLVQLQHKEWQLWKKSKAKSLRIFGGWCCCRRNGRPTDQWTVLHPSPTMILLAAVKFQREATCLPCHAFHFMNPSISSTDPCSLLLVKLQAKQFSSDACKVTAGRPSFSVTS